jgi:hypothetical protein
VKIFINLEELKDKLLQVKMLAAQHQSLYIDEIDLLLNKNKLWISFATLDIRQK